MADFLDELRRLKGEETAPMPPSIYTNTMVNIEATRRREAVAEFLYRHREEIVGLVKAVDVTLREAVANNRRSASLERARAALDQR